MVVAQPPPGMCVIPVWIKRRPSLLLGLDGTGQAARLLAMSTEHVVVMSTTDSESAARALAAGVINAKLGACAQIVGPITSVYRWESEVQTEQEWRVEIKTATDRVVELTEHIKANHSYDVPEIVATPLTGGSTDYLEWLVQETRS